MSKSKQSWGEWIQSLFYGNEVALDTNKIAELVILADANGLPAPKIEPTDLLQSTILLSQTLKQGLDDGVSGLQASRLDIEDLAASVVPPVIENSSPGNSDTIKEVSHIEMEKLIKPVIPPLPPFAKKSEPDDELSQSTLSAIEKVNNALKDPRLKHKITEKLNKDTSSAIEKPIDIERNIQKHFKTLLPKDQRNIIEILESDNKRNIAGNTAILNKDVPDNDNIEEIIRKDFSTLSLTYQEKILGILKNDLQQNVNNIKSEKRINPEEIKLANLKANLLSELGTKFGERKSKQQNDTTVQSIIEPPKTSAEKTDGVDNGSDKGTAKANLENFFSARFHKKIPEASSFAGGISKKPKPEPTLKSVEKIGLSIDQLVATAEGRTR